MAEITYKPLLEVKNRLYILSLPYAEKILNIGAGEGNFIEMYIFTPFVKEIVNIDKIGEEGSTFNLCIEKYKNSKNIKNYWCDVTDMSMFEDNRFDMVIFNHVIEHLTKDEIKKAFSEIKRVLKVDGCLQLATPNKKIRKRLKTYLANPYHIEEYTFEEMKEMLNKYDFKIEHAFGMGHYNYDGPESLKDMMEHDVEDPENSIGLWFLCKNKYREVKMFWPQTKLPKKPFLPPGYNIRTFHSGDEETYVQLMNESKVLGEWTIKKIKHVLKNPLSPNGIYFLRYNNKIIGSVCILDRSNKKKKRGEVGWLVISHEYRGKHLGKILCNFAVEQLKKLGYKDIFVITSNALIPAIKTYLGIGFEPKIKGPEYKLFWEKLCKKYNLGEKR